MIKDWLRLVLYIFSERSETMKKRGRPKIDNPKDKIIKCRVTMDQKVEIQAFLLEHRMSLLDAIYLGIEAKRNEEKYWK